MSTEQAFAYWPQLRDAVQPTRIERRNFKGSFNPGAEWSALVQQVENGTFRLRAPASTPAGLCGPFFVRGDCLSPLFDAHVDYYDPTMEPQDGDLVLVQMDPRKARRIEERVRSDPKLLAMHGAGPMDLVSKFLRCFGNEWVLMCNTGISYLHDHVRGESYRVLGVLRYVERQGVPLYGCGPVVVHNIDPNAATDVYAVTDAGPITLTLAGTDTDDYFQVAGRQTMNAARTWSFYNAQKGVFHARTFTGPPHALRANTPSGCTAIEGRYDQLTQRVQTGAVVAYERSAAELDAEQRVKREQRARQRIAALELAQHRPMRELAIDPNSAEAKRRLAEIDGEIAVLRGALTRLA